MTLNTLWQSALTIICNTSKHVEIYSIFVLFKNNYQIFKIQSYFLIISFNNYENFMHACDVLVIQELWELLKTCLVQMRYFLGSQVT